MDDVTGYHSGCPTNVIGDAEWGGIGGYNRDSNGDTHVVEAGMSTLSNSSTNNFPWAEWIDQDSSGRKIAGVGQMFFEKSSPIPTGDQVETYAAVDPASGNVDFAVFDLTNGSDYSGMTTPVIDPQTKLSFWDPTSGEFIDERLANLDSNGNPSFDNLYTWYNSNVAWQQGNRWEDTSGNSYTANPFPNDGPSGVDNPNWVEMFGAGSLNGSNLSPAT